MSAASMLGFIDEMEKLSSRAGMARVAAKGARGVQRAISAHGSEVASSAMARRKKGKKKVAFMANVGNAIKQTGRYLGHHAGDVAHKAGDTLKAFANPLKSIAKGTEHTVQQAFGAPSLGGKALGAGMLGYQAYGTYQGLKGLKEDDGSGMGRGERLGNLAGGLAGGLIGQPHGFTGQMLGSYVAQKGLGAVGKGADTVIQKIRNAKAARRDPNWEQNSRSVLALGRPNLRLPVEEADKVPA